MAALRLRTAYFQAKVIAALDGRRDETPADRSQPALEPSAGWHIFRHNLLPPNINTLHIWSDGGPKHFKISSCIYYFSTLRHKHNINISYHFYQSYHGHNGCDASASHAKKRINISQRDKDIAYQNAAHLEESINTLNHGCLEYVECRSQWKVDKVILYGRSRVVYTSSVLKQPADLRWTSWRWTLVEYYLISW